MRCKELPIQYCSICSYDARANAKAEQPRPASSASGSEDLSQAECYAAFVCAYKTTRTRSILLKPPPTLSSPRGPQVCAPVLFSVFQAAIVERRQRSFEDIHNGLIDADILHGTGEEIKVVLAVLFVD